MTGFNSEAPYFFFLSYMSSSNIETFWSRSAKLPFVIRLECSRVTEPQATGYGAANCRFHCVFRHLPWTHQHFPCLNVDSLCPGCQACPRRAKSRRETRGGFWPVVQKEVQSQTKVDVHGMPGCRKFEFARLYHVLLGPTCTTSSRQMQNIGTSSSAQPPGNEGPHPGAKRQPSGMPSRATRTTAAPACCAGLMRVQSLSEKWALTLEKHRFTMQMIQSRPQCEWKRLCSDYSMLLRDCF